MTETEQKMEKATFGGGCFWGIEEAFREVPGVLETTAGFMGGTTENPTSEEVYTNMTGHAEVVHLTYDPSRVSYEDLLKIFWENHNPTTRNRQGPDIGTQYRSVIFFHTPEQKKTAERSRDVLDKSGIWKSPIVTQIVPAEPFHKAEDYHQKYLQKRGLRSCHY